MLARSVKLLCGLDQLGDVTGPPYKFVHYLPVGVDGAEEPLPDIDQSSPSIACLQNLMSNYGGALEETFLSTSHSKFYTAIRD